MTIFLTSGTWLKTSKTANGGFFMSVDFRMNVMGEILIGISAMLLFEKLITTKQYSKHPNSKGIFKSEGIYIAFDNSTHDFWVEEFKDINSAFNWIRR
jgi:hypothetical protein